VGSGICSSIRPNDYIWTIDWTEYIENLSDPGPFLIHHPGVTPGDSGLASNDLFTLDYQFILHDMKRGA